MTFEGPSRETETSEASVPHKSPAFYCGRVCIDVDKGEVRVAGVEIWLTENEWRIIKTLASKPGQLFSKEDLFQVVYAAEPNKVLKSNTLNAFISHLRTKIGNGVIHTYRGHGYRLNCFG